MTQHKCAAEALQFVQSGQSVFIHGAAAAPTVLIQGLIENANRLSEVELIHLHTEDTASYADPKFAGTFKVTSLFTGENLRHYPTSERIDYLPCFLSEIPQLFLSGRKRVDVALLHLSSPDQHGYCTLGTSVDVARAAAQSATVIIAQINSKMPRVLGDGFIHISDIDHYIEVDQPLPDLTSREPNQRETEIGLRVAALVEDGSCLQVGIGAIPNAVLAALQNHRHLGVHSEMWSDGILKLILSGVVDNSLKKVHRGKTVSGFVFGSQALYDFINDNPSVIQLGADYVNNPAIIARNSKVVAINSAVEIDLTGQICADSIGHKIISGVGGQVDFMRGAALSAGGKPIIALTSQTKSKQSKIVAQLKPGAGVVSTRAHAHYIVTEFGSVDLAGLTLTERAKQLIQIAHPDHRQDLARQWSEFHQA